MSELLLTSLFIIPCFYLNKMFNSPFKCLLSVLCLLGMTSAPAQPANFRFERIGMEEGLSNLTIQAIHQDHHGYLWIGTWDGLSKYDGYQFTHYFSQPFDPHSLSFNNILSLYEDNERTLWVGTEIGLNAFDRKRDRFIRFNPIRADSSPIRLSVISGLAKDPNGYLWVSSIRRAGLSRFHSKDSSLVLIQSGNIHDLLIDDIWLWMGNSKGIHCWNPITTKKVSLQEFHPAMEGLKGFNVQKLYKDPISGDLWIGTTQGLFHYNGLDLSRYGEADGLGRSFVKAIWRDSKRNLWVGTTSGLYFQSKKGQPFIHLTHDPNLPTSLSHDVINCLYEDRSANLWIGTNRGGLCKLNLNSRPKFNAFSTADFSSTPNQLVVSALATDQQGRVWAANSRGLTAFDRRSHQMVSHYDIDLPLAQRWKGGRISSLYAAEGLLWIGTKDGYLNTLDLLKGTFTPISPEGPKDRYGAVHIRAIQPHQPGQFLIAHSSGLTLINPSGHILQYYYRFINKATQEKWAYYLWDVKVSDSCHIYIGSGSGLIKLNTCTDSLDFFQLDKSTRESYNGVFCVYLDQHNGVWTGGYGGGLNWLSPSSGGFRHYGSKEGLPNNYVYGILEDDNHHLWMSTNNGIARFDPSTEIFTSYHVEDGLQAEEFSSSSYHQAADGEMFFGGVNGFVSFYPDSIRDRSSSFQPDVRLTDVKLFGHDLQLDSLVEELDHLQFSFAKNLQLALHVSAFDYGRPGKNLYRYRLLGLDEEWSNPTPSPVMTFTQLPPGEYTFEVRASNSDGIFSERTRQLQITVLPLLHQRWSFRIFAGLLVLAGIAWLVYRRARRINRREREHLQYRMATAKQEALAAQFDHHFTFNSLNSIQRFITENNQEKAIYYISRFGKLIRRVMNHARENFITLEEELTTMELYLSLEALRFKDKISYEITVDPAIDPFTTEIPSMLIQPYVENAIWHGLMPSEHKGKISLSFLQGVDQLICIIEDNGIGRKKAQALKNKSALKHESRGMKITEERLETLHLLTGKEMYVQIFDLEDTLGHPEGTRVEVVIPL